MKSKFIIIGLLISFCIGLNSCFVKPSQMEMPLVFVHYVADSLAQYVFADTEQNWSQQKVGFIENGEDGSAYPGNAALGLVDLKDITSGDFLYKCHHDLYFGYPYNYGILRVFACVYDVKWEDAASCNLKETNILCAHPLDFYIEMEYSKIKKYNHYKNITSGEQLLAIVNRMIDDGSFIEAIDRICFINDGPILYGKSGYLQYLRDYENGLRDIYIPKIDWLLE